MKVVHDNWADMISMISWWYIYCKRVWCLRKTVLEDNGHHTIKANVCRYSISERNIQCLSRIYTLHWLNGRDVVHDACAQLKCCDF